jgi:hypothetical protein
VRLAVVRPGKGWGRSRGALGFDLRGLDGVEGLPASGAPVARGGGCRGCLLVGEGGSVGRETRRRATTSAREGEGRTTRLATGLRPGLVATGARRYRRRTAGRGGSVRLEKQRRLYARAEDGQG